MGYLTEQERQRIENECDMLKGNINRMRVTDSLEELCKQSDYAKHRILDIENIVNNRFTDQT